MVATEEAKLKERNDAIKKQEEEDRKSGKVKPHKKLEKSEKKDGKKDGKEDEDKPDNKPRVP
jgi:hypothetical protein